MQTAFECDIDSSQEITNDPFQGFTWHQKCTINEIKDHGFNLVNQLHCSVIRVLCADLEQLNSSNESGQTGANNTSLRNIQNHSMFFGNSPVPDNHQNGMLINSILKMEECQIDHLWPELVRLLILHSDERHDIDLESFNDSNYVSDLFRKLGAVTP